MYDENELFDELFRTIRMGGDTVQRLSDILMKMESMTAPSATASAAETTQDFIFTGQSTDLSYFADHPSMSADMIESIQDANLKEAVKQEFNKAIHDGKLKMDTKTGTITMTEKGKDFINKPEFSRANAANRQSAAATALQQTETIGIELDGTIQDLNYFRYSDTLDMKSVLQSGDVQAQVKVLENFKSLQEGGFITVTGSTAKITERGTGLINTSLFKQGFGVGVEKTATAIPAAGTVIVAATKALTEVAKVVTSNGLQH